MKKPKIFIACDATDLTKVKKIIAQSQTNKIKVGYKFGLEFMNSKNGRQFVSKLRNKIIFVDLKLNDTVHTMISAVKALKDLKINLMSNTFEAFRFDFVHKSNFSSENKKIEITATKKGRSYGIIQWIKIEMGDGLKHENHPSNLTSASGWQKILYLFATSRFCSFY